MGFFDNSRNRGSDLPKGLFDADAERNEEEHQIHRITTDHPFMNELGLGSFTTGVLYRWWNEVDEHGQYINQKYFIDPKTNEANESFPATAVPATPTLLLLGEEESRADFGDKDSDIGKNQFAFQAWRTTTKDVGGLTDGYYVTKYIDEGHTEEWSFFQDGTNDAKGQRDYSMSQVNLSDFLDVSDPATTGREVFEVDNGKGGMQEYYFNSITPITETIVCNHYVNEIADLVDRSEWDEEKFARMEFVNDIQAAKQSAGMQGFVEWSGLVPFRIATAPATDSTKDLVVCERSEWVKYRLYIYPPGHENSTKRGLVMANPTFAAPPTNPRGNAYQFHDDGRYSAFPKGSRAAEVAADLDMTYNEYLGKWESGTPQMIAVVDQPVPAAKFLTIEEMRGMRVEESLNNPPDSHSHIVFGSGTAMPLTQQNANPKQWAPNYAGERRTNIAGEFIPDCKDSLTKDTMIIFNPSLKAYERDDRVLLNRINGQWLAIDFPTGVKPEDEIVAGFDGRWDFSYFATNVVHFFRDAHFNQIDYTHIEQGFHHEFYKDDAYNKNTYGDEAFDFVDLSGGGYHQFTSFDMMDNKIAGTREAKDEEGNVIASNAYCLTNPIEAPNGDQIGGDSDGENTGSFFGCIFPDGYAADTERINEYRSERNWDVESTTAESGHDPESEDPDDHRWRRLWNSANHTIDNTNYVFRYFGPTGLVTKISSTTLPFNDGESRNDAKNLKDEAGNFYQMLTDDDVALKHVPADIMLNAAPSGANGQPIRNLHFIDIMYKDPSAEHGYTEHSASTRAQWFFQRGQNWLWRTYEEGTVGDVKNHMESSAFDFKPTRPNRIMFRPLKAEVYAQFSLDDTPIDGNIITDFHTEIHKLRDRFGAWTAYGQRSLMKPSSHIAHQRELKYDHATRPYLPITHKDMDSIYLRNFWLEGNIGAIYNDHWGLQFNVDIPGEKPPSWDSDPAVQERRYLVSPKAYLPTSERFRHDAYGLKRNFWMHGGTQSSDDAIERTNPHWRLEGSPATNLGEPENVRGAGAVGVIGAVATASATKKFIFHTEYRVGCWSWALVGIGLIHYPSWGKGGNYKDFNTTALNVKIYHAHPREATIYDPRFFAVHHFNEGIISFDEHGEYFVPTKFEIVSQIDPTSGPTEDDPDKEWEKKDYAYQIDDRVYDCDTRVPCRVVQNPLPPDTDEVLVGPFNFPEELTYNDLVWGDGANTVDDEWLKGLKYDQWNVSTERRGKLLPFTYPKKTISARQFSVVLENNEDAYENGGYAISVNSTNFGNRYGRNADTMPFYTEEGEPKTSATGYMPEDYPNIAAVVRKPGAGYKTGETFTCDPIYGIDLEVKIDYIATDAGAVGAITVRSLGQDFTFGMFHNTGVEINQTRGTGVKLISGGSNPSKDGTGFDGFLTQGVVSEAGTVIVDGPLDEAGRGGEAVAEYTRPVDPKPEIATASQFNLLAPKSINKDSERPMPGGLKEGDASDTLDITNPSTNGKYDLFFHYHNDISHTFLSADHHPEPSRWGNDEQYMILEIDQE